MQRRVGNYLKKGCGISKALVCPKARERVYRVGSIADESNPFPDVIDGVAANQRELSARADLLETAEVILKCLGKFERKCLVFKRKQLICLFGIGRPHNGAFVIR